MLLLNGVAYANGAAWANGATKTEYFNIAHSTGLEWMV
jgi:hypothetical protein